MCAREDRSVQNALLLPCDRKLQVWDLRVRILGFGGEHAKNASDLAPKPEKIAPDLQVILGYHLHHLSLRLNLSINININW